MIRYSFNYRFIVNFLFSYDIDSKNYKFYIGIDVKMVTFFEQGFHLSL